MSHDQQISDQKTFVALGRFVVNFSHVVGALEEGLIHLFRTAHDCPTELLAAAMGERAADQILKSFVAVFRWRYGRDMLQRDEQIIKCLRREVTSLIEDRNRLMHDSWLHRNEGGSKAPALIGRYRRRVSGEGVEHELSDFGPELIERRADDAERLSSIINAVAFYGRPDAIGPELHPRLQIIDKRVVRREGWSYGDPEPKH